MRLKISHVILLVIVSSVLGAFAMSLLKKESPIRNNSSSSSKKSREPILGQAEFVRGENKDFSKLKKYIENQWALKDILALESWEEVQPKQKNKKPLIVAVIDTGIDTKHPCFKNQLWVNKAEIPDNGIDDDQDGFIDNIHGWNFVDNNNNIEDNHGHGTHISGIIAAQGPPHCEMIGIAPHVQIMTLKYYEEGADNSHNITNTVKAIDFARKKGADIINYSGGGPGANQKEKAAIAKTADKGIIFVAALGNEGSKIGKKFKYYPANYNLANIVIVQSHNEKEERVDSSNYIEKRAGEPQRVQTAPGENIYSTLPASLYRRSQLKNPVDAVRNLASLFKKEHYGRMTGTSQATAIATGVVALVKARQPGWSMETVIQLVTQVQKLSAYGAVTMRGQNVDSQDQVDTTNVVVHHDSDNPDKVVDILKNPKAQRHNRDSSQTDTFEQIKNISNIVNPSQK